MSDTHTISMAASKLNWDDIDQRARQIGFKDRSKYIQYLAERDIHYGRYKKYQGVLNTLLMLLGFTIVILLILLV